MLALILATGCESKQDAWLPPESAMPDTLNAVTMIPGWVQPAVAGGNTAAYLMLINNTQIADTLLGATSFETASAVQLHTYVEADNDDNMVRMRPLERIVLLPSDTVRFEPGTTHLMFVDLSRDLAAGDTVELSLAFSYQGMQDIRLPVRTPDDMAPSMMQ